ncbi:transient receptor potential cation channel subfamily M member-like 2 isoform X2 [Physella acuta]|uniref:transient receptor potential cation channel subfamily M member-like 2 isoform X2 n=1 Tax=Physella acuta TaxID=109671 RepID=UPI0027DB8FD2|nr:transient receptor potential cation channel subfamily M member-like 2 isoform X2 [Physella acuta]
MEWLLNWLYRKKQTGQPDHVITVPTNEETQLSMEQAAGGVWSENVETQRRLSRATKEQRARNTSTSQTLGGVIRFVSEDSLQSETKYMLVCEDSGEQVERLASDLTRVWGLKPPRLVLSIISNSQHFQPWKRSKDIEDFQDGLMKAATLTEMWILTDGRNSELTALVGEAVVREKSRRKILATEQTVVRFLSDNVLPELIVMGVISSNSLSPGLVSELMAKVPLKEALTLQLEDTHAQKMLNPNLTHLFVTSEEMGLSAVSNFVHKLEIRLMRRTDRTLFTGESETPVVSTPLIGVLIQGGLDDIDRVMTLLRKNIPVIVIGGQGKAASLLAFAFRATQESYGVEGYAAYVKTELLKRLTDVFPEEFRDNSLSRNQYRDKILQCITFATQGDSQLMTVVERNTSLELKDLSKVILTAVLTSHSTQSEVPTMEELQGKMQLIIDWMQPDLAVSELFDKFSANKFTVDEHLFQQVLLRPDREKFVELFLDRGFILHKYLNHKRLEMLYERCCDKDFFASICLETILGEKVHFQQPLSENFVSSTDCPLNSLLLVLTGVKHLVDPLLLSVNASTNREETAVVAEQRALHALLYWSVLTNNTKLTKILWSRTNDPMSMALILSTMYNRLGRQWISDHDLKLKIMDTGRKFGELAVEMLDLNYRESPEQALNCLTLRHADVQNHTAVDLALIGQNKYFIAHSCCQKHISNMWFGNIRLSQGNIGYFTLSDHVKICLCVLLVLPTYLWVEVVDPHEARGLYGSRSNIGKRSQYKAQTIGFRNIWLRLFVYRVWQNLMVLRKLYYLWRAPITKFWMAQIFYFLFLLLFVQALGEPFCGDHNKNKLVVIWLFGLMCDQVYRTAIKKKQYSEVSIVSNLRTLLVVCYTLCLMIFCRLMYPNLLPFAYVKVMLSFSLVYFFFNAMTYLFPVSPVYGPMMINISVMMKKDLISWLKMWSLTLVSGAVSMYAVVYPAHPLGWPGFFKAFRRAIFGLFMTDLSDLRADNPCSCLYNYSHQFGCQVDKIPGDIKDRLAQCPNDNLSSYLIVLQFLFNTKLVYNTLIFAITSETLQNTHEKSIEIWKYQFFKLVISNQQRPFLPVPLVLALYPFIAIRFLYNTCRRLCRAFCPCCRKPKDRVTLSNDFHVWRSLIRIHKKDEKLKLDKLNSSRETQERLRLLAKEQANHGKHMENLHDRLFGVINSQTSLSLTLEHMRHVLEETAKKKFQTPGEVMTLRDQHSKCRMSPYPGTTIRRFPVFDKNVSWEESYPSYDPPSFSKEISLYDVTRQPYVDPDLFEIMRQREERAKLDVADMDSSDVLWLEFNPQFNQEREEWTSGGEKYTVNRVSLAVKDEQNFQYTVDSSGVPRNPMGRTGMRGRGNLWRWGPNHMIYAIVSRWKNIYNAADISMGHKMVNGKKVLEIMVVQDELVNEDSLPGDFITGRVNKFNVLCEMFMKELLGEKEVPGTTQLDQDDMIQFFRQFVSSDFIFSGILGRSMSSSLSSSMVYKGYMDDTNNTDNAWVEAEIWSFHYHSNDKLDKKILQRERHWREVSSQMHLASSQLPHVLEVARVLDESSS